MVFGSVKIFFGILLTFAFCLPIVTMINGANYGLVFEHWLRYGLLTAAIVLIPAFCVYKIFILKSLIGRKLIWLDERTVNKINAERKLLQKLCIIFAFVFAIIMLATYIITSAVSASTFIERERFDHPDQFMEYMQSEYDAWYNEGYSDLPPNERPQDPLKKWAEIDGKEYYYNPILYKSIDILQHENGDWEIVVTTDAAYNNGIHMYNLLNIGLISLHIINLAVCVIWYLIKTKKRQPG